MIARVVVDLPAVDKVFDYLIPDADAERVRVGTLVRVALHGRRVRGWVVDVVDAPAPGVEVRPLAKVSSDGPPPEVVALARWTAHRWGGRWVHVLRTSSPPVGVRTPAPPLPPPAAEAPRPAVHRLPPSADRLPLLLEATARPSIVVVSHLAAASRLAARLRRERRTVALLAGEVRRSDWEAAARGDAVVVGTRTAVFAPIPDAALEAVVVLDEHDEALQAEQAPTWHARDVAIERARRAGATCTIVSPCPTLHAVEAGNLITAGGSERNGWAQVEVIDRRNDDPVRSGPVSERLGRMLIDVRPGRVVCVLNRMGRARLLACLGCGTVLACERCGAAVGQDRPEALACLACGDERPAVCQDCGAARHKVVRAGVARLADDLRALTGEEVVEVTAASGDVPPNARVLVGTEAVLHRLPAASCAVVALVDMDQELLAPRYRAGEHSLVLLARASRAAGDRRGGGRVVVQTRRPDHPAVRAALLGDPDRFVAAERPVRQALGFPPYGALALVSGVGHLAWLAAAAPLAPLGVELLDPTDGTVLVRAPAAGVLGDFLASVPRPPERIRVEVDPARA